MQAEFNDRKTKHYLATNVINITLMSKHAIVRPHLLVTDDVINHDSNDNQGLKDFFPSFVLKFGKWLEFSLYIYSKNMCFNRILFSRLK